MIDSQGWYFTATQAGAFVSSDRGATWNALHVIMHERSGQIMDRVPHDYQRIVPDFRGDGIAFPSDQGLHILNRSSTTFQLTSAVGDMKNAIALSALIAPNKNGSRNLVVNMWDWDVCASFDDGATWAGWTPTEKAPGNCGEGGGGQGMGASGNLIMFHHQHWWQSSDGGHNFLCGDLPGTAGAFDYVRIKGSRTEPNGTCFAVLNAPAPAALALPRAASASALASAGAARGRSDSAASAARIGDEPDCRAKSASVSDAWCQQNCPAVCPPALCSCDDDDDDDGGYTGHNYRPDAADGKDPSDGDHDMDPKVRVDVCLWGARRKRWRTNTL